MIYRFIMLSDEVEDFRREFKLDAEASFLDLHNTILKSVDYKTGEMSSFFICDNDWSKGTEITLEAMNTSSEVDSIIMGETPLSEYLEDERQKLMFVFDYLSERAYFMELREIIFGENLAKPKVTKSIGNPPEQFVVVEEEPVVVIPVVTPMIEEEDDEFYGDDDYNDDELDDGGLGDDDDSNNDGDAFDGVDDDINIDDLEIEG